MTDGSAFRMGLFLSGWLDPDAPSAPQVDQLLARAQLAEASGFSSVWVGQHFLGDPRPVLDTSVFLSAIARSTTSIEIGGVFLLPLEHPVHLAETFVTLDHVSGGRFQFCGALGWAPREFAALDVPIRQRAGRFEETLDIIRRLWSEDEPWDYKGRYFEFDQIRMLSRPQRPGGIPVFIGASSDPGIKRVARLGGNWLGSSHTPLEDLVRFSELFDAELVAAGTPAGRRPLLRHCMVAPTTEVATERFVAAFEAYYRALGDWGIFREVVGDKHSVENSEMRLPPGRAIVGSPDDVMEQIDEYRRLGFDEIIFQVGLPGTPEEFVAESLQLLGTDVLPRLGAVTTA